MRGLTLHQPWASLMAHPEELFRKKIETRPRLTNYRGWMAVQAAKELPDYVYYEYTENERMRVALRRIGITSYGDLATKLPLGMIVCVVRVVAVISTDTDKPLLRACLPRPNSYEYAFGNYEPGRHAWVTRDCHILPQPVPARGNQTLWKVPPDVQREIDRQIAPQPHYFD